MAVGAAVLLAAGAAIQGMPPLEPRLWAIIGWLAVVNTAFAFTLWNHTLRTLTAAESSIINGTMLIQVAILAWLFLDERLTPGEVFGMVLAGAGAVAVQWHEKGIGREQ
jgi:drug/metabolite transporter (DMT)-like permease